MAQMRTSVGMQKQILELQAQGLSVRRIAKALKKSRKTVCKIIEQSAVVLAKPEPDWTKSVDWKKVRDEVGRGVSLSILKEEYTSSERF